MRLRTKLIFAFLMLSLMLGINVALSVWSIRFLENESARPLDSVQSVMRAFHSIKRHGERQIDLLVNIEHGSQENTLETVRSIEDMIHDELGVLEQLPTSAMRSGISTVENLRVRSESIRSRLEVGFDPEGGGELVGMIDLRHELIERIEGQILEDAKLASDFGAVLERRVLSIIFVSVLSVLVFGSLLFILVHRWLLVPIESLRLGTQRMSRGEFDDQIPISRMDELGQLTAEFNRMGWLVRDMKQHEIEQERLAAMGEMAQRIVHNLRTPISGIRALAETTADELPDSSDLRDLQERIIESVDKFDVWLNEMLRSSSPLTLHTSAVDIDGLVRSVVEMHTTSAHSKGVSIMYRSELHTLDIQGDRQHLEHCIVALLSNAVSFADAGTDIEIELMVDNQHTPAVWRLVVSNDGPMIPKDLHLSIFRPYFTTRAGGTGIGLAMVQRVVEQHQGRIRVDSPLNTANQTGCSFVVEIPIHRRVDA